MTRYRGILAAAAATCSLLVVGTTSVSAEAFSSRTLLDVSVRSFKPLRLPPEVSFADDCCIVYVLGTDTNLWREDFSQGQGEYFRSGVDSGVIDYQPYDGNIVYVLGSDHTLWREFGSASNRQGVDANVQDFQALDANWVLVRGTDNQLWLENGNANNRSLIDPVAGKFQAVDTVIYVLHANGVLWRLQGSNWTSAEVDNGVADFSAVDRNTVYVLGSDQHLWNETGAANTRVLVDTGVQSFVPLDNKEILVLGTDAKLWRELGNSGTRDLVDVTVFVDSSNPHVPYFAWEPDQSDPNIFVMGWDRNVWIEGMPSQIGGGNTGNGSMGSSGGSSGIANGGMGSAPPCFTCYSNCGFGCALEGTYCTLISANAAAPGCGVCCGDEASCYASSTCH